MMKPLLRTAAIIIAGLCASGAAQAATTDALTNLPLYPKNEFASKDVQNVCGTSVQNATYSALSGNLSQVDAWYAGHLHGFKMTHGATRNYPYDIFVNADATMSVTVAGSGPNRGVEAIVYHKNARPQSRSNLMNWLDGGSPICS
jgi:hypothetical protein